MDLTNPLIMDGELTASNLSPDAAAPKTSHAGLHVMVVDDDVICLAIAAALLKTWKYEVVTVKSAQDAITTLRRRNNFFHLIVTDVHMPEMDGFEFQRRVHEEFNLPVVMMSADDKESSMLRGLEAGAVFYIVKPISHDDLKNLWQYTVVPKKAKSHNVVIQEITSAAPAGTSMLEKTSDNEVESLINNGEVKEVINKRDFKRKTSRNGKEKGDTPAPRKAKVIWTSALHNRFLEAARKIGLERAVPKRILEIMNVPGLTRENVASHLQKYRIFLKRVMETSSHGGMITGKNISDKTLRSSFATGHSPLMINTIQQGFPQFLNHQQVLRSSQFQPRFLANLPASNSLSISTSIFPSHQQALTSNPVLPHQLGYGQTHPMNKHDQFLQQPACEGMSSTTIQLYNHQQKSELVPNAMPTNNTFTALGFPGHNNNILGIQSSTTTINNPDIKLNLVTGSGFAGGDMLNEFNGEYGLLFEGNKLASLRNHVNSGYSGDQGACSSTRFGGTSQIPYRFSSVIQQENNNPVLLSSPLLPQENDLVGEGENNSYVLDQVARNITTTAPVENISIPQLTKNDLNENFGQNQQKYPSCNERQSDGGLTRYDYGSGLNQSDGYLRSLDPSYPSQQGVREIAENGANNGNIAELNLPWNQGADETDLMESVFGPAMY